MLCVVRSPPISIEPLMDMVFITTKDIVILKPKVTLSLSIVIRTYQFHFTTVVHISSFRVSGQKIFISITPCSALYHLYTSSISCGRYIRSYIFMISYFVKKYKTLFYDHETDFLFHNN